MKKLILSIVFAVIFLVPLISAEVIMDITGSYTAKNYPQTCYQDWRGSLDGKLISTTDVNAGWLTKSDCNCYTITDTGGKLGCWKAVTSANHGFKFQRNVQVTQGDQIDIKFGYFPPKALYYVYSTTRATIFKNGTDWNYCKDYVTVEEQDAFNPNIVHNPLPPFSDIISDKVNFSISADGVNWKLCSSYSFNFKLPNGQCYHGELYEATISCLADFNSDILYVKIQQSGGSYNDMWDYIKVSSSKPVVPTPEPDVQCRFNPNIECAGMYHEPCEGTYIWGCANAQCVSKCEKPPVECRTALDCKN